MQLPIDRLKFASALASNKTVLDIGGIKMPDCLESSLFARKYREIKAFSYRYHIVDYQESADHRIDFNVSGSPAQLRQILQMVKPEVILCMETLEHVNYHFEVLQELALAVYEYDSTVFITVPNNSNWIINAAGWNHDHSISFVQDVAHRFIERSNLGNFNVQYMPCMGRYLWYWPLVWALSGFQSTSHGFLVTKEERTQE